MVIHKVQADDFAAGDCRRSNICLGQAAAHHLPCHLRAGGQQPDWPSRASLPCLPCRCPAAAQLPGPAASAAQDPAGGCASSAGQVSLRAPSHSGFFPCMASCMHSVQQSLISWLGQPKGSLSFLLVSLHGHVCATHRGLHLNDCNTCL